MSSIVISFSFSLNEFFIFFEVIAMMLKREPVVVNPLFLHESELRQSLSGEWLFRLDPDDVGIKEKWFDFSYIFQE